RPRLRHGHRRVRGPRRGAVRDRLPQSGARLRQLLDQGGELRLGPRTDERPGDLVRARRGRAAVAGRAAMVAVRRHDPGVADPVGAYHDLLFAAGTADETAEALRAGQEARSLVFGSRPLCVALRPQLVSRARYDAAMAAARGITGALVR